MHEEEQELHWDEEAVITGDQKDEEESKVQESETTEIETEQNTVDPPVVSQPPESSNQSPEVNIQFCALYISVLQKAASEEEEIDEDWGSWE